MPLNNEGILVGAPEQTKATGAIYMGPVLSTVPADIDAALKAIEDWDPTGYVDQEGVKLTPETSTTDVVDWGLNLVRRILSGFSGKLSWSWLQFGKEEWEAAVGKDHVTVANGKMHIGIGAHLPEKRGCAIKIKDGDRRVLILVGNGQVTNLAEMTFAASDAVKLPVEFSCYDDGSGDCIHIYTDDGAASGAAVLEAA